MTTMTSFRIPLSMGECVAKFDREIPNRNYNVTVLSARGKHQLAPMIKDHGGICIGCETRWADRIEFSEPFPVDVVLDIVY